MTGLIGCGRLRVMREKYRIATYEAFLPIGLTLTIPFRNSIKVPLGSEMSASPINEVHTGALTS